MKNFFVLIVSVLVGIFFVVPTACFAQKGFSFFTPKVSDRAHLNLVLGKLVGDSLKKNPSGLVFIKGTIATTPRIIFKAIRENHPTVWLTSVKYLSEYITGLVSILPKQNGREIGLTRILHGSKGYFIDSTGYKRKFHQGEFVWFDPQNGEDILAGDCSNIIIPEKKSVVLPVKKTALLKVVSKKIPPKKPNLEFEFCSDFVVAKGQTPTAPFRVCGATKFIQLRYPGEMVPVVYGICDANNRLVYSRRVEILLEDYSQGEEDLVQKNQGLSLVRSEGCTQVFIKRGNDYKTFEPFNSDKTNGERDEIFLFVEGAKEEVKTLSIPWAVNIKNVVRDEKPILSVFQKGRNITASISNPSGSFVTGVLRLIQKRGRREVVLIRTNLREVVSNSGNQSREVFDFGKLSKGQYLITFSQAELEGKDIYLREKLVKEIEVK